MKPYQRYTSFVAAAALALAGAAQAQSGSGSSSGSANRSGSTLPNTSSPASTSGSSMSSSSLSGSPSMGNISRVTKDEVRQQFTAKDLIGAEVYDRAGEKVGDITDISFAGAFPAGLASSYNLSRSSQGSADDATRSSSPTTRTGGSASTSPGTAGTPGAASPSGTLSPSSPSVAGSPARGPGGSLSPSASASGFASMAMEPRVFISVGGLMGIGDDLVSVSPTELTFNSAEDRFELSANKADVVALAEQENRPGYAASGSSMAGSTAAGKQQFADEAAKVQNAIEQDSDTSSYAYKITVTSDGEDVELRGSVNSEEQHQQILEAARGATSSRIDDKIEVKQ